MDEVRIRPTVSNQHLMINSEQEISSSSREIKNSTNTIESRSINISEWITVLVLCFVNLINYMDRFTIAGNNFYLFSFHFFNVLFDLFLFLSQEFELSLLSHNLKIENMKIIVFLIADVWLMR